MIWKLFVVLVLFLVLVLLVLLGQEEKRMYEFPWTYILFSRPRNAFYFLPHPSHSLDESHDDSLTRSISIPLRGDILDTLPDRGGTQSHHHQRTHRTHHPG